MTIGTVLAVLAALAVVLLLTAPIFARGGGGRGGGFRGGGMRGGGFSRPSGGFSRPSGGFARPSTPSVRPSPGYRPPSGAGPNRPGQGNRPDNRPWTGNNHINTGDVNINSNNGGWGYGWGSGAGLALGAAAATGAAIAAGSDGGGNYYESAPTTVYNAPSPAPVYTLPSGCTAVTVGGVEYQNCGGTFYQPFYQGSSVVYQPVPAPY